LIVLERAVQSLETLGKVAATFSSQQGSTLAVSHSTYLQILLSLVAEAPLAESMLRKINNGSVNAVDVNVKGKKRLVSSEYGIFSGVKWSNDLQLTMPECHLIRRNEVRHLAGMQVDSVT
jgi:broad specificity phosphatase PhoE